MRRSRKLNGRKIPGADSSVDQGLQSSALYRVPRVDALDSLPEENECENQDFTALYDPNKGFVDSYKEGYTPKFFGESSGFTFSQALGKDVMPNIPSRRRLEFWTIPSVSPHRWAIG